MVRQEVLPSSSMTNIINEFSNDQNHLIINTHHTDVQKHQI